MEKVQIMEICHLVRHFSTELEGLVVQSKKRDSMSAEELLKKILHRTDSFKTGIELLIEKGNK